MKYYVIAGEASGDLHASNLLRGINHLDPQAKIRAWGGDLMEAQGAKLVKHYRDLAFMGFVEVFMNLRTILKNIDLCKKDIEEWQPDAVILVDYPGFNLRIAPFVKSLGIPVFYYISPAIWAWKKNRAYKIRENVDRMFCILPFEKDFYAKYDYNADFVGHPLLDAVERFRTSPGAFAVEGDGRKIVAVLPGSRTQEIRKILPTLIAVSKNFPQYRFIIAGAPSQPESFYREVMKGEEMEIVFGKTYMLLNQSYAGLITSGTATLETALFNVPQVVCYTANYVSYRIAKYVANVKFISLPNLIMDREIVKELIQVDFSVPVISEELRKITEDQSKREEMLKDYGTLFGKLGGKGASERTAMAIIEHLKK